MPEPMLKPILCLDFDGVIHSYTSGWMGADQIPDPPVPGMADFIEESVDYFSVQIFSSRSNQLGGIDAMATWLAHWLSLQLGVRQATEIMEMLDFPTEKPPALVTLDDRALTFTGVWPTMETLQNFKPWNKGASESLDSQVDRLAKFIMSSIDGEPSQDEGAIDCAIRLLRESVK